jgi:hypothetical protein
MNRIVCAAWKGGCSQEWLAPQKEVWQQIQVSSSQ